MPLMPCAASPSAMARTSSGCILVKSATWSKVRAVLSTSHTAVAFGISGALLMANLLCAPPPPEGEAVVISDDGNYALYKPSRADGAMACWWCGSRRRTMIGTSEIEAPDALDSAPKPAQVLYQQVP